MLDGVIMGCVCIDMEAGRPFATSQGPAELGDFEGDCAECGRILDISRSCSSVSVHGFVFVGALCWFGGFFASWLFGWVDAL